MQNISLKNAIIEHIYQEILDSKYAPNDHIKEVELAKTLNVSRAPVREALNDLVNYGILEKFERRGIFLKEITKKEILDTYQTKGMIEGYLAADFILNATEQDYATLDALIEKMEINAKESTKGCVDVGDEFHKMCIKYSTNEILLDTLERVNIKSHILFFQNWGKFYTVKDIINRHQKILDALKSKDRMLVESVIREHYNETGMNIALKLA
jgi:DNA-binding GntR family transcriptional regulator